MESEMEENKYIEMAKGMETLGPAYFDGRDVAEKICAKFQDEHFKPLIKDFGNKFTEYLWESVSNYLLSDTESNIQGNIWRIVDYSIKGLLAGDEWAIKKYVMEKYNAENIRAAIAKHIPTELQDMRLADLEKENERLKKDLEFARSRY